MPVISSGTSKEPVTMKKIIAIMFIAAVFSGCVTKPEFYTIEHTTGYYPIHSTLPNDAVIVRENFIESKYRSALYFNYFPIYNHGTRFFVTSIGKMNYFQKVEPLPIDLYPVYPHVEAIMPDGSVFYRDRPIPSKVEDLLPLSQTENWIKNHLPCLIVEVQAHFLGGFKNEAVFSLKAIDPETKAIVLHLRKQAALLYMAETDFYSPLLNGFLEWVQGKEITVDKSK
jgi:hypothetical protein